MFTVETAMQYMRDVIKYKLPIDPRIDMRNSISGYAYGYGSGSHHHNYVGGLAVHTAEVLHECLAMAGPGSEIDHMVLITAALWHDHGKLFEYHLMEDGKIGHTEYATRIGHVVGSVLEFVEFYPWDAKKNAIIHAMLAHHGRLAWGSPVEPVTREAWILHNADMRSSRGYVND